MGSQQTSVPVADYALTYALRGLLYLLKHINNVKHVQLTGRNNALILDKLWTASAFFSQEGRTLVIRQVVVPTLNDESNITALARLAGELPRVDAIELLPFHNYGMHKYATLGRKYRLEALAPPSTDKLEEYRGIIESYGITCQFGGL